MNFLSYFLLIMNSYIVIGTTMDDSKLIRERNRINMIVDIITLNYKNNGWSTIICFGNFPDEFYKKMQNISYSFTITNIEREDEDIEDVVGYYANTVIMSLQDIDQYDDMISRVIGSPHWHPHSNIIIYYHQQNYNILPKLFFSLWYRKAVNSIIVQYNDTQEVLLISNYSPFVSDGNQFDNNYGCWTTTKIGAPYSGFDDGLTCENKCHNVSIHSKLKSLYHGTCIGFSTTAVPYKATQTLSALKLFEEIGENFHNYTFTAYVTELKPFLLVGDNGNGSFALRGRDGLVWHYISKLMNFSIDLGPSLSTIKEPFKFERSVQQIFDFSLRKADLFLPPIYLYDLIIAQVDYCVPHKDSGICIMSYRAGFESALFNGKIIQDNVEIFIRCIGGFICIWMVFIGYKGIERGGLSFDQIGKDLLNTCRNALLITLINPPRRQSFRIFLTIIIWSFFVINFATQAVVISLLTAVKRGKEVETFEDIVEKGYNIYGMASPDVILPEDEEKFLVISSRIVSVQDLTGCIFKFTKNQQQFCLVDCASGRYYERNLLNEHGQRYLHIAQDRIHSRYLTFLQMKHSPITNQFNKYLSIFFEAGLIQKWEQYRFKDVKEDPPIRPLGMKDFKNVYNMYCISIGITLVVFVFELVLFKVKKIMQKCKIK